MCEQTCGALVFFDASAVCEMLGERAGVDAAAASEINKILSLDQSGFIARRCGRRGLFE